MTHPKMLFMIHTFLLALLAFLVQADVPSNVTHIIKDGNHINGTVQEQSLVPLGPQMGWQIFDPNNPASDDKWYHYVSKGEYFNCLMAANDKAAGWLVQDPRNPKSAQSIWSATPASLKKGLENWFWHELPADYSECDFEAKGLRPLFDALGLNSKSARKVDGSWDPDGHNECIMLNHFDEDDDTPKHEQLYGVGPTIYSATGAHYDFGINKVGGLIIVTNIQSPVLAVQDADNWHRQAAPEELPQLRAASDVIWCRWVQDNPAVRGLRYFAAHYVMNDATVQIVNRIFHGMGNGAHPEAYPGLTFYADSWEGKALIGSPIGAIAAHMILQHKRELGVKQIVAVTIVSDNLRLDWYNNQPIIPFHLFYHIANVPVDQITNPPPWEIQPPPGGDVDDRRGNLTEEY